MTKTATTTTKTVVAKPADKDKTPRTRYNWTDELKNEIADKLDAAKRGEREAILEAYSEQTGVAPASIYATVQGFRNGKSGKKAGKKGMSAMDRLAALKNEQETLQQEVVTELQTELAASIARQAEIEEQLTEMGAELTPAA